MAEILGTDGDDAGAARLNGTPENDLINGRAGDDELFGLGGSDTLIGQDGDDTLVPGPSDGDSAQNVQPGEGTDLVDLTGADGFINIEYRGHPSGLDVLLNEEEDVARVEDGAGSVDTIIGFAKQARDGGIRVQTSNFDDTIDVTARDRAAYIHVDPDNGSDTITLRGGEGTVRLSLDADGAPGDPGLEVDLAAGSVVAPNGDEDLIIVAAPQGRLEIRTGAENDSITGASGRHEEYVWRGGDDTIDGGPGTDTFTGNQLGTTDLSIDLTLGTASGLVDGQTYQVSLFNIENIVGSHGSDVLRGDGADNRIQGGLGDDVLISGGGVSNRLEGDGGDDTLIAVGSNDILDGGDGDDVLRFAGISEGAVSIARPGLGQNTVLGSERQWNADGGHSLQYSDLSGVSGLVFEIGAQGTGTVRSGDGRVNDTFSFIGFFAGGEDDDRFTSADEPDGSSRFQAFRGGPGNDTITSGENSLDVLDYRGERFVNDAVQAVTVDIGAGVATDTFGEEDRFTGIEGAWGTALADTFIGSASQEFSEFRGFAGDDTIRGAAVAEREDGSLVGFETADYSRDVSDGGGRRVVVDLAAETATDGFGDTDTLIRVDGVLGTGGGDILRGHDGINSFSGFMGNDLMEGRGGADSLRGFEGNDTLDGGAGADLMEGGTGNDLYIVDNADDEIFDEGGFDEVRTSTTYALADGIELGVATGERNVRLDGTAGNEELRGNAGNNILVGFGGEDTMTGRAGIDSFVLTSLRGTDPNLRITDWERGVDQLAVDDQLIGLGTQGIDIRDLTVEVFRDVRASGAVSYKAGTGELRLDLDGDGDRELVATLEGGARLTLEDVLLF